MISSKCSIIAILKNRCNSKCTYKDNTGFTLLKCTIFIGYIALNRLIQSKTKTSVILSRATIDIIQEPVASGQEYRNPWSSNGDATVFDHDTIINHLTGIKLSDFGMKKLDRLADAMLGF